jgi:parallel beta helix pectate lyase-like protein
MRRLAVILVLLALVTPAAAAPLFVPTPSFGLDPVWPPTCFVNNQHAASIDLDNPCGTPERPRKTVPLALPAGAVYEVRGGPYLTSSNPQWTASGTASNPAAVVGVGHPIFVGNGIGHRVRPAGGYLIVEGLHFFATKVEITGTSIAFRQNEVDGNLSTQGVVVIGSGAVLSENQIHHNGDAQSPVENDRHGVYVVPGTVFTWILGNDIHHNGGDAVQVGNTSKAEPWAQYVFISGNALHEDRENGVDVKVARDVLVTENLIYGYQPTSSSAGECVVVHNDPERVWLVGNVAVSCRSGLVSSGAKGFFPIGNLVAYMHGESTASLYGPCAIAAWNTSFFWPLYNTIDASDAAICAPQLVASRHDVVGNAVGGVTYGIRLGPGVQATVSHNLVPPDPVGWVDPASFDYHLQPGAPAFEAGTIGHDAVALYQSLYGISIAVDVYGQLRGSGAWSIGAAQQ